jgi:hypothetical protein
VLTGHAIPQVAHLYPHSMLKLSSVRGSPINFWHMLKVFWSDDRVQEWRNVLFPDQNNPDKGIETCCNLICLSPDAYAYWTKAYFALQPIELSDDKKRLDVKFHWMPRCDYLSEVDLLSPPSPLEGLDGGSGIKLFRFPTDRRICSGDMFSLTTDDPVTHPLPHYGLLEMQWILQRVVAMSGVAKIYDNFDNDDDDTMALRDEWDQYEEDERDPYMEDRDQNPYEEESPPMLVNQIFSTVFSAASAFSITSPREQTSDSIIFLCGLQRILTSQ